MEDGHDEFFTRDGKEEYAAKDSKGLPEELKVLRPLGAWVLQLVAEGGAKDIVGVIGKSQVLWISDRAQRRGKFEGELLTEVGESVFFVLMSFLFFEVVKFAQVGAGAWVANRCFRRGILWIVKSGKAMFSCAEVAVVERVRMHLHEHDDTMKREEDLGGPGPA